MLSSYTVIETLLSIAVLLLAVYELRSLLAAKREGRTENWSRVVTLGTIIALVTVHVVMSWVYRSLEGEGPIEAFGTPTTPWAYLLLGGLMALIAAFETLSMFRARVMGLTSNVSRLVSYTLMVFILLAMLGLAQRKWEHYLDRLDQTATQETARVSE
jgi:hypothetical protein